MVWSSVVVQETGGGGRSGHAEAPKKDTSASDDTISVRRIKLE